MKWFIKVVVFVCLILFAFWYSPVKVVYTMDRSLQYKWWLWFGIKDFALGSYVEFIPSVQNEYTKGKVLVKQVRCVYPQVLHVQGLDYYCDGEFLGRAKLEDSKKRPIKPFVYSGVVPKDCFFAMGETENSYDSRYFGFVCKEHVRAVLVPLAKGPDFDKLLLRSR